MAKSRQRLKPLTFTRIMAQTVMILVIVLWYVATQLPYKQLGKCQQLGLLCGT